MKPKSERMSLPQWDGDPSGWRDCQQEVRLHKTGENLEVNWSVAARLVGGLRGAARRVHCMFSPAVLYNYHKSVDHLKWKDSSESSIARICSWLVAEDFTA